ncbi:MAG: hypothetical protein PHY95_02205 [Candidatus ainarchaeum sp.]|nr:hypothetical protein [Candidatus ainarchaeum sp.]
MAIDLILAVGLIGAFMQLAAYVLNLFGRISHDSIPYISSNAFGCILTSYYAISTQDFPFLLLEMVWGGAAFYKLFGKVSKRKRGSSPSSL